MQKFFLSLFLISGLASADILQGVVSSTLDDKLDSVKVFWKDKSTAFTYTDKNGAFNLNTDLGTAILPGLEVSEVRWNPGLQAFTWNPALEPVEIRLHSLSGQFLQGSGGRTQSGHYALGSMLPGVLVVSIFVHERWHRFSAVELGSGFTFRMASTHSVFAAKASSMAFNLVFEKTGFQTVELPAVATQSLPVVMEYSDARAKAIADYRKNYLGSKVTNTELAWSGNSANCIPGTISDLAQSRTLQRINYFRRVVGLLPIVLVPADNTTAQASALMMAANGTLNHTPPPTWNCYTTAGADGAGKSNLAGGSHSAQSITQYMFDAGSNNTFVGHRRWILYPKVKNMGHGSTDNYNALYMLGPNSMQANYPPNTPGFVSWPPSGFAPSALVFPRWSFSLPKLTTTVTDLSAAKVEMVGPNAQAINLTQLTLANGYGDDTMVWEPQGIVLNSAQDISYTVKITGVKGGVAGGAYTYNVTVFAAPLQ